MRSIHFYLLDKSEKYAINDIMKIKLLAIITVLLIILSTLSFLSYSKMTIGLTTGIFNPCLSLIKGGSVSGLVFDYDISAKYTLSFEINLLESESVPLSGIQLRYGVQMKIVTFCPRILVKFPWGVNNDFYLGGNLFVYNVREIRSSVSFVESDTTYDCPIGSEIVFGIQISKNRFFIKSEMQYLSFKQAQSFQNPISWGATKYMFILGIKL